MESGITLGPTVGYHTDTLTYFLDTGTGQRGRGEKTTQKKKKWVTFYLFSCWNACCMHDISFKKERYLWKRTRGRIRLTWIVFRFSTAMSLNTHFTFKQTVTNDHIQYLMRLLCELSPRNTPPFFITTENCWVCVKNVKGLGSAVVHTLLIHIVILSSLEAGNLLHVKQISWDDFIWFNWESRKGLMEAVNGKTGPNRSMDDWQITYLCFWVNALGPVEQQIYSNKN